MASANSEAPYDVVIIGAGISGINAAYRLQTRLPNYRFVILEARDCIAGTWSFWKYPGVRSDSAMGVFTFGWAPWPHNTNMADADLIASYIEHAAASEGIDKKILLRHCLKSSSWDSDEQAWTLSVDVSGEDGSKQAKEFKTRWVISCAGYYDYENPLPAEIPGIDNFRGEVVHPQFWNDGIAYAGKKIVIIGSGATAVTLLPALAKTAASVTMLQRSPSYVLPLPGKEGILIFLRKWLPERWALMLTWWKNMIQETFFVWLVTTYPNFGRKLVTSRMKTLLPKDFVDKHFNPRYNVFEQRLCFCPEGDFFDALRQGNCDVVTDTIKTVTETGILTTSGQTLEADMIVTATGLLLKFSSGMPMQVDGVAIDQVVHQRYIWNGAMMEGVPNQGAIIGYTAGTWTPGADARACMLIKVMKHMEKCGATSATPFIDPEERKTFPAKPPLTNSSTYIVQALERLPLVADIGPWRNGKRWISDMYRLLLGNVTDGMIYNKPIKAKDV